MKPRVGLQHLPLFNAYPLSHVIHDLPRLRIARPFFGLESKVAVAIWGVVSLQVVETGTSLRRDDTGHNPQGCGEITIV